jgi:hypothetical protein
VPSGRSAYLRVLEENGAPPPMNAPRKRNQTPIATAARSGDRKRLLSALRDTISKQLDEGVPPRDLAALSKRLVDIANEIAEIDAEVEGDDVSHAAATPDEAWPAS